MPEPFTIAQVSPYPWEDEHEVNAFVARARGELADAGHRVVVLAPTHSTALVRESRRLIRAGELFGPTAGCACSASASCCRWRARGAARCRRRRSTSRARSRRRSRRAPPDFVHVHEPFAPERVVGRAAPLALAQRRDLPRARRARALDPGRAPLRRAVLRPPRRAHRVLRGHARPDAADLPGRLPRAAPGRAARSSAPSTRARCGSRSATRRSAARCGCSCARCAGCRPSSSGRRPCSCPPARRRRSARA